MSKTETAQRILDEIVKLRRNQKSRQASNPLLMSSEQNKALQDLLKQAREYVSYFRELGVETIDSETATPLVGQVTVSQAKALSNEPALPRSSAAPSHGAKASFRAPIGRSCRTKGIPNTLWR
jgi:hypothetical protein